MQLIINCIYSASIIFIVAISFSIIFLTARFFHFAHGAVITACAYICYLFLQAMSLPLIISILFALAGGIGLGGFLEKFIYRPLRHKNSSPLVLLLASLGIYIVIQNIIAMAFGDDTKMIAGPSVTPAMNFLGLRLTHVQMAAIITAMLVLIAKTILLDKTKLGLSLRAVADNPELAKISGIKFDNAMALAFMLGSFLAGVTGIYQALDTGITPTMGLPLLLPGVVAVVIGGNGKTLGVAIASLLIAVLKHMAGWWLGTHWEETATFLLLLAFLLCRPQGIFGKAIRKATI